MRYETKSKLVLDERWREHLTAGQQRIVDLGTTRSRRLLPSTGYVKGAAS